MLSCRRCIVTGRVQGVFYRATTQQEARRLGLVGYARNLPDGSVEVLAIGEAAQVDAFVHWLWRGSPASHVTGVEERVLNSTAFPDYATFTTA